MADQRRRTRMTQRFSMVLALAIAALTAVAAAQTSPRGTFTPPRTPWGDPDLQGVWPGTAMVGVPLQRDQAFGTRNLLTEEEFQARVKQAQNTDEEALADFDPVTA